MRSPTCPFTSLLLVFRAATSLARLRPACGCRPGAIPSLTKPGRTSVAATRRSRLGDEAPRRPAAEHEPVQGRGARVVRGGIDDAEAAVGRDSRQARPEVGEARTG